MSAETTNEKRKSDDSEEIVITVPKKTVRPIAKIEEDNDLLVAYDETFHTCIVYLFGTFAEFNDVRRKLFGYAKELPEAHGYAVHDIVLDMKMAGIIVWINSIHKKDECIPILCHEISHLADQVATHTGTQDSSGEERAYIIEREICRVSKMFGIKIAPENEVANLKRLLKPENA